MRAPVATPAASTGTELVGEDPRSGSCQADVFAGHVVLSLRRDGSPLLRIVRRDGSEIALDVHPGVPAAGHPPRAQRGVRRRPGRRCVVESYTEPTALVLRRPGHRASGPCSSARRCPGTTRGVRLRAVSCVQAADGELVPVTVAAATTPRSTAPRPACSTATARTSPATSPSSSPRALAARPRRGLRARARPRRRRAGAPLVARRPAASTSRTRFADFVAVADGLADGLVDGERIVSRGLSAGGLLLGAVFSQAPATAGAAWSPRSRSSTSSPRCSTSLPADRAGVGRVGRPAPSRGLRLDARVLPVRQPAAAGDRPRPARHRRRARPAGHVLGAGEVGGRAARQRPGRSPRLLLRMEPGAGAHVGPSGRFGHLRYEAEVYAWVLERLLPSTEPGADG